MFICSGELVATVFVERYLALWLKAPEIDSHRKSNETTKY